MIKNKNDFVHYFETNIRPKYEDLIAEGVKTKKEVKKLARRGGIILVLSIIIPLIIFGPWAAFLTLPITGFILYMVAVKNPKIFSTLNNWEQSLYTYKDQIFGEIISEVLPGFTYSNKDSISKEEFEDYSFVSSHLVDKFVSEDSFIGYLNNRKLRISECLLYEERRRDNARFYVKLFSGLISEIDINSDPDFKMVVTRKHFQRGDIQVWIDNLGIEQENLEEISISNVFIDDNYIILTNDPIKTNKILQPRNVEKIVRLIENEDKNICIGIYNNKFAILTENDDNMFEVFEEGKFEPGIIWDELISAFESIKDLEELQFDFKNL